jgi:hypothetical protein
VERRAAPEADFAATVQHEHRISASLGGRTVKGRQREARQLSLFR